MPSVADTKRMNVAAFSICPAGSDVTVLLYASVVTVFCKSALLLPPNTRFHPLDSGMSALIM